MTMLPTVAPSPQIRWEALRFASSARISFHRWKVAQARFSEEFPTSNTSWERVSQQLSCIHNGPSRKMSEATVTGKLNLTRGTHQI
jgi:hypothetical protein